MVSAFFSQKSPHKPVKSLACGILQLNDALMLAIIHGDESKPCGWKAAQAGWAELEVHLQQSTETPASATASVQNAIDRANNHVRQWHGLCKGAEAGFSVAVIDQDGAYTCWHGETSAFFWFDGEMLREIEYDNRPTTQGKLIEHQGLLLLNKGLLHHPKHPFVPDLAHWFLDSDPIFASNALAQKYAQGHDEDLAALMIKF